MSSSLVLGRLCSDILRDLLGEKELLSSSSFKQSSRTL
jgi:hypothetical protein